MLRCLCFFAALLLALPAAAETITITVGALSSTPRTISAAHVTRLQDAVRAEFAQQGLPAPTNQQIVDYLFGRAVAGWINFVRRQEQDAAIAGVTDVGITQ